MKWWKKEIKHVSLDAQLKIQNCTCDTYITKAGLTIRSSSFLVLSLSKKKIANYMPQQWFNGHEKMTSDKISRFVNSPWQRSWLCNCSVYASWCRHRRILIYRMDQAWWEAYFAVAYQCTMYMNLQGNSQIILVPLLQDYLWPVSGRCKNHTIPCVTNKTRYIMAIKAVWRASRR